MIDTEKIKKSHDPYDDFAGNVLVKREEFDEIMQEMKRIQELLKESEQGNIIRGGLLEILLQARADGDEHIGNMAARMIDRLDEGKPIYDTKEK